MSNKSKSDFSAEDKKWGKRRYVTIGNSVILTGALIVLISLAFMIFDMENIDRLVSLCVPLVISGVVVIIFGVILTYFKFKK